MQQSKLIAKVLQEFAERKIQQFFFTPNAIANLIGEKGVNFASYSADMRRILEMKV